MDKTEHNVTRDTVHDMDYMGPDDHDESGNFTDIDDVEVCYFLYVDFHLAGGYFTGHDP